ncbi:MAG: hypothetical protein ACW98X_07655 [Promethearchaeota archaeon]|jgi:hypothetical protein
MNTTDFDLIKEGRDDIVILKQDNLKLLSNIEDKTIDLIYCDISERAIEIAKKRIKK